jgi:hypothetical protein
MGRIGLDRSRTPLFKVLRFIACCRTGEEGTGGNSVALPWLTRLKIFIAGLDCFALTAEVPLVGGKGVSLTRLFNISKPLSTAVAFAPVRLITTGASSPPHFRLRLRFSMSVVSVIASNALQGGGGRKSIRWSSLVGKEEDEGRC